VKLDNRDLLRCCHNAWMHAFSEANCLLGWRAVGIRPFTLRVMWELKERKETESQVMSNAEKRTGLDFSRFTLQAISVATAGDGRSRHVGGPRRDEEVSDEDDDGGGGDGAGGDAAAGPSRTRRALNSSMVWHLGAITADVAYRVVDEYEKEREARASAKAQRSAQTQQRAEERRLSALASNATDHVKSLVRQKGWATGRGGLTRDLLETVLVAAGQPKNVRGQDLVTRVQRLLGGKELLGFPEDAAGPAAVPPPPPQVAPP
jgi:hypothetical protein